MIIWRKLVSCGTFELNLVSEQCGSGRLLHHSFAACILLARRRKVSFVSWHGEGDVGEEDGRGGRSLLYLGPEEGGSLYLGVEVEEGGAFCILRVGGRRIMTSKLSMQAYNLQSIDNSQFPSLHSASLQFPISNLRCSSRPLHNSFASWWVGGREMFVPWRGRRLILASSRR